MSKATSLLLDFLRAAAALSVFASHCNWAWYPDRGILRWWGHDAVIVFFVLSGHVISFVTFTKETSPKPYILARLSRLYSVVLPALLLTAVLQTVGLVLNPAFYQPLTRSQDVAHYIFCGLFLQSIWGLNATPASNNPFWSLSYEFWYYVVFGILIFSKSWKIKITSFLVIGLITGLKIWLLAPIWFVGVFAYTYSHKIILNRSLSLIGLILSLIATVIFMAYLPYYPGRLPGEAPLYGSNVFVRDNIIGLFIGMFIWFFEQSFNSAPVNRYLESPIRWIAAHTFSLYLYHYPLLVFMTSTGIFDPKKVWSVSLEAILILTLILFLSTFTESKRHWWRNAFNYFWLKIEARIS